MAFWVTVKGLTRKALKMHLCVNRNMSGTKLLITVIWLPGRTVDERKVADGPFVNYARGIFSSVPSRFNIHCLKMNRICLYWIRPTPFVRRRISVLFSVGLRYGRRINNALLDIFQYSYFMHYKFQELFRSDIWDVGFRWVLLSDCTGPCHIYICTWILSC